MLKSPSITSFNDIILNQEATTYSNNYFILAHNSAETHKVYQNINEKNHNQSQLEDLLAGLNPNKFVYYYC